MRERQEDAIGASRMAIPLANRPLDYRRGFMVATIAGLLMTFLGGFGTGAVPFGMRLAYWMVVMEAGALIGIGASTGVCSWGRLAQHPLIEGALISLLIALPLTTVVIGVTLAFFGGRAPGVVGLVETFVAVMVVTGAITAINYARGRPIAASVEHTPQLTPAIPVATSGSAFADDVSEATRAPALQRRPALMDRLPAYLRDAELHAIQSEDHYLRVHTAAGSDLILMRMADALLAVEEVDGARTHRSWWVARSSVRSVERRDGRAELTLTDGITAPVSRGYMASLQQLGWFV